MTAGSRGSSISDWELEPNLATECSKWEIFLQFWLILLAI